MLSRFPEGANLERGLVGVLVTVFLLTGISYALVVPAFETPDELYHYAFARHLAAGNGLPVQGPELSGPWEQEGSQPPLYYGLIALATAGIDQRGLEDFAVRNPRANLGDPHQPGNKNFILFSAESRPLTGVNLALHVGRLVSVILGTLTVFLTYLLTRYAFPADRWSRLLATALVAAIPQFAFISASLSNDNLITVVSAAVLVCLAAMNCRPLLREIRWWEWTGLGLLLGLGAISKLQGLGLLPLAAFSFLIHAKRHGEWRPLVQGALWVGGVVLIVAGWWYARNIFLYGDPFGTRSLLSITGERVEPLALQGLFGELRGLQMSFFGIFGWFSILLPSWTYSIFELFTVLALSGAIVASLVSYRVSRRSNAPQVQVGSAVRISWAWALISLALLAYWISIAQGSQGRLLFPAISALAIVAVVGLRFWAGFLPRAARVGLGIIVPLGLWSCSLFVLVELLPDSYGLDATASTVKELPADATPIGMVYGDGIELVGARLPERESFTGNTVPITLYLRAHNEQVQDHELFIHWLNASGNQIGNVTTHPGWGTRPLTLWQPGILYEDAYQVPLNRRSPALARMYVGFTDPASTVLESEGLLPVVGGGPRIESRVIWTHYDRLEPLDVQFDTGITLLGVALGQRDTQFSTQQTLVLEENRSLWAAMKWQDAAGSDVGYATSLRLYPAGREGGWVYQEDSNLWKPVRAEMHNPNYAGQIDSVVQLVIPSELPSGEYELRLVIYDADTLQPAVRVGVWEPELLLARIRLK